MNLFIKLYTFIDHNACNVSSGKRFLGYIFDWFLGSLFTMLPLSIMWLLATHDMEHMSAVNIMNLAHYVSDTYAYIGGILSILFAFFYYIFIPWKIYPGQTPGKRMMGFKIVKTNDNEIDFKTLIIRQFIGIMIIEGAMYSVSGILHSLLSLATDINFITVLMYVGFVITVGSAFLLLKGESKRALHDYLANTKIIEFEVDDPEDERTKEYV